MTGRTDDIASLRKWQDRIRKEMHFTEAMTPGEFHINPHTCMCMRCTPPCRVRLHGRMTPCWSLAVKPVAPKIGEAPKTQVSLETTLKREEDVREFKETLSRTLRSPQEKFRRPMTVSQEIGWYWKEAEHPPTKVLSHAIHV